MRKILWPYGNIESANFKFVLSIFKSIHLVSVLGLIFGLIVTVPGFLVGLATGEGNFVAFLVRGYTFLVFPFLLFMVSALGLILVSIESKVSDESIN